MPVCGCECGGILVHHFVCVLQYALETQVNLQTARCSFLFACCISYTSSLTHSLTVAHSLSPTHSRSLSPSLYALTLTLSLTHSCSQVYFSDHCEGVVVTVPLTHSRRLPQETQERLARLNDWHYPTKTRACFSSKRCFYAELSACLSV